MPALKFEVFRDLSEATTEKILSHLPVKRCQVGEVLLRGEQLNDRVYLIEDGELEVWKGEPNTPEAVRLRTLVAGSCFGQMSTINGEPVTASIVVVAPTTVRIMVLEDLPPDLGLQRQVMLNLARTLIGRLSNLADSLKTMHESEIRALRVVSSASAFITRVLIGLSFYMLSMPVVSYLTPLLPNNSLVSFFFIAAFSWLVLNYIDGQPGIARDHFCMTLARWPRQVGRGLLWALPLMSVFFAIKLLIMRGHPGEYKLWNPEAAFPPDQPPTLTLWAMYALAYALLTFGQEFIRCATQGTLEMIYQRDTATNRWRSILIADIVFTSLHIHLGILFAAQAFVAGLFFGVVFRQERSYLAVAVAHAVVGVWAVFIVGVPG